MFEIFTRHYHVCIHIQTVRPSSTKLIDYSDSSHNIDPNDGKSTMGHDFYLGETLITWCSQKQDNVVLSSCEAEFMASTKAARQAIWLRDLLGDEIDPKLSDKVVIKIDNQFAIVLTKNPVFHGRNKHIHTTFHFIMECLEDELTEVKALRRIKFKELR